MSMAKNQPKTCHCRRRSKPTWTWGRRPNDHCGIHGNAGIQSKRLSWSSHALSHHWRLKVISRLKHAYHCMKILFGMRWHQSFILWVHKHTHQSSMTTIQTFKSCISSSCWGRCSSNYSWFWHIPARKVIATSDNLIGNYGAYGKTSEITLKVWELTIDGHYWSTHSCSFISCS